MGGGVAIVNPDKEIEVRPCLVSEEIGKEELDQGVEIHVLTNTVQRENWFKLIYLQFLWGRKKAWLANAISENNQEYFGIVREYCYELQSSGV